MSPNAFKSLHTLAGVFTAIPAASFSCLSDITNYVLLVEQARSRCLTDLIPLKAELAPLEALVQVAVPEYFIDCAAAIAVSSSIQCNLSNRLQAGSLQRGSRVGTLSQEDTHLLVDLWGQVEASRALFEFVLRQSSQAVSSAVGRSVKGESLRAQYRVLLLGVEQLILEVGTRYGERSTMNEVAVAIDWCLAHLRSDDYRGILSAVELELLDLAV